jgi:hypothetical protein
MAIEPRFEDLARLPEQEIRPYDEFQAKKKEILGS